MGLKCAVLEKAFKIVKLKEKWESVHLPSPSLKGRSVDWNFSQQWEVSVKFPSNIQRERSKIKEEPKCCAVDIRERLRDGWQKVVCGVNNVKNFAEQCSWCLESNLGQILNILIFWVPEV